MLDLKHTFNFSRATLITPIHCKTSRRLLKPAIISQSKHIKQRAGFYQIPPYLTDIILRENDIKDDSNVHNI